MDSVAKDDPHELIRQAVEKLMNLRDMLKTYGMLSARLRNETDQATAGERKRMRSLNQYAKQGAESLIHHQKELITSGEVKVALIEVLREKLDELSAGAQRQLDYVKVDIHQDKGSISVYFSRQRNIFDDVHHGHAEFDSFGQVIFLRDTFGDQIISSNSLAHAF